MLFVDLFDDAEFNISTKPTGIQDIEKYSDELRRLFNDNAKLYRSADLSLGTDEVFVDIMLDEIENDQSFGDVVITFFLLASYEEV